MLRPVKSISICPHTRNTHKHRVVLPNLEQENEAGKILGNWYNLPAIHLISPATSLSVLLGLHTLSGYLLIICTLCASHSYPNCVEGCPSYDLKPHHCSLYRWWLCFVCWSSSQEAEDMTLSAHTAICSQSDFTELVAQVYKDHLQTNILTMVRILLRTPRVIERWSRTMPSSTWYS